MKTLVEYLADYILTEMDRQDDMSIYDTDDLKEWLKQGIDAYESTENCTVHNLYRCQIYHHTGLLLFDCTTLKE